ncbi:hypothetical protein FRC07_007224 [Ceratobasidium sp. 392]|nr:hypothetical protein FRC07_007224 [Ceratobasidium sp. 392]
MELPKFVPGGATGSITVTTRLRTLAMLGRPIGPESNCLIGSMDPEEALELLMKRAQMHNQVLSREETEAATKLVQDLGCLALAIVHAGAYIWCSKISITKYRELYLEHTQAALERYSNLPGNVEEYEKTVYTTWLMSYERLKLRTKQTLELIAYLHHSRITEEIFKRAAMNRNWVSAIPPGENEDAKRIYVRDYLESLLKAERWDSNTFAAVMEDLLLYSLVDYDRVSEAYTLHVLVQDWACSGVLHPRETALEHASYLLALSIDESENAEGHIYRRGLLLHVTRLLDRSTVVNPANGDRFLEVYHEHKLWNDIERLTEMVLKASRQHLGEQHCTIVRSMVYLALTYSNQGRWDDAETLYREILSENERLLDELHPTVQSNLASIYFKQGRLDEAEALYRQSLDANKQVFGE